ncbi:MAG: hypothetical protein ACE5FU_11775 [Nitrospinota bacterium]
MSIRSIFRISPLQKELMVTIVLTLTIGFGATSFFSIRENLDDLEKVEKAKIVKVKENTFEVELSKLSGKTFTVKKKNRYRQYQRNQRIRVRILVNAKGEITRVEEV